MKKTIFTLIIMVLAGFLLTSCEKQCVCYDRTNNTSFIASYYYYIYSKSDCDDTEDVYNSDDVHFNPYGHDIECIYENK